MHRFPDGFSLTMATLCLIGFCLTVAVSACEAKAEVMPHGPLQYKGELQHKGD
jgi:hypothetical protein